MAGHLATKMTSLDHMSVFTRSIKYDDDTEDRWLNNITNQMRDILAHKPNTSSPARLLGFRHLLDCKKLHINKIIMSVIRNIDAVKSTITSNTYSNIREIIAKISLQMHNEYGIAIGESPNNPDYYQLYPYPYFRYGKSPIEGCNLPFICTEQFDIYDAEH